MPLLYFSCDKNNAVKSSDSMLKLSEHQTSVSKIGNAYHVNLDVIEKNLNKKDLTKNLQMRRFNEITNAEVIPFFIKDFLKEVQFVDDFNMAQKEEDWQNGDLPNLFPTLTGKKYYNVTLHDSVFEVQLKQRNLPNKKLIYCGIDGNCCIIACFNGGRKNTSQIAILQFSGEKIDNYWFDYSSEVVQGKIDLIQKLKTNRLPKTKERFRGC